MQPRVCQALDLVDIVGSNQFTTAGLGKVVERVNILKPGFTQRRIEQLALFVARKCRMRLIAYPRLDMNIVVAESDLFAVRIVRQRTPFGIEVMGRRDFRGGQRY